MHATVAADDSNKSLTMHFADSPNHRSTTASMGLAMAPHRQAPGQFKEEPNDSPARPGCPGLKKHVVDNEPLGLQRRRGWETPLAPLSSPPPTTALPAAAIRRSFVVKPLILLSPYAASVSRSRIHIAQRPLSYDNKPTMPIWGLKRHLLAWTWWLWQFSHTVWKGLPSPSQLSKATLASKEAHAKPSGRWYSTAIQMDWPQVSLVLMGGEERGQREGTAPPTPPPASTEQMTSLRCEIALYRAVPLISRWA
ncbi:hypothetical protein GGTG_11475 [Gaeumannomyces tritici R3-111a-1]|uniref:Uncharacterized protein n=1 Tax=Gaeumannomyces tritici (strain R3-111a-1) TaxID=644352 RepID=J3PDA7_GAET3|nr:hypothetical protein GGTG_11475 [Gaeumannomyces tritici R3-111a-1]EJT70452.1 hypothetical protein GGTG_11475 [Gaeumannomyces tritici R3-111a-1]